MKYLVYILLICFVMVSFSKNEKEISDEIYSKVCGNISQNPSSKSIMEAEKLFNQEINKIDVKKRDAVRSEFIKSLENCFYSLQFSKTLNKSSINTTVGGNSSKYIKLKDIEYSFKLAPHENPAFSINLTFSAIGKLPEEKEILEITGKIDLFNAVGEKLTSFNIYATPDFRKIITSGEGDATIKVYLNPVWASFSKEPLQTAAESFKVIENASSFKVSFDFITSGEQQKPETKEKEEKKYQDILDKLDKKN